MTKEEAAVVEGFSLSGEEVNQLTDKHFKITAEPYYKEIASISEPTKIDKRLIIPIALANDTRVEWYANKTSQKVIIAAKGRSLKAWVGYEGEFVIKEQKVGKEDKKVIYLKE